jgi:hypothetical protein
MSFVLETYQQNVVNMVHQYHTEISEIESHLRLRAMANDVSDRELELLRRLKIEKTEITLPLREPARSFPSPPRRPFRRRRMTPVAILKPAYRCSDL